MRLIFLGLVLFYLQNYGCSTAPDSSAGQILLKSDESVLPTNTTPTADDTADDGNVTVPILQITDYHYFDWPKIGYQIFMKKMIEALQTLKFFVSLDPMILKVTRTYVLTNDTDLNFLDNNSTDEDNNETNLQDNQIIETNTESPLQVTSFGKSKKSSDGDKIVSLVKKELNHSDEATDVTKTKTEKGGFFSGISLALSGLYNTIVDWF